MFYLGSMHWEFLHLESLEPQGKNNALAAVSDSCDFFFFFNFLIFISRSTGAVFCGLVNVLVLIL